MTRLVAVSGADSPTSKTRALVAAVADERGGELIDLLQLPADGLLGRREDADVIRAVEAAASAVEVETATDPSYVRTQRPLPRSGKGSLFAKGGMEPRAMPHA